MKLRTIRNSISILLFSYTFLIGSNAYSQDWIHGIKAIGSDQSDGLYNDSDIAVDGKGNMVIAGQYNNSITFGEHSIETDDGFYPDIFLCRIRADYSVDWLKHIETGFNNGEEIAVSLDDDGNIYVTGTKDGKVFVSKYDSLGSLTWDQDFEDKVQGYGTSVKTDLFDNVYVSGSSGWNFFIAKLSYSGEVIWTKNIWVNYSAGCTISDLAVDPLGEIYFAGKFEINLPLDDITLTYTNSWGPSVFWGKMDSSGNFIWAKSGVGRSTEKISLALTSSGHLMLAGGVSGGNVSLDGYTVPRGNCCDGATPFIAKSDLDGNILWAKAGTQNYYGSNPIDILADYAGNLYLTGSYFTCYGTFCTEADYYVEKYNMDGDPIWRKDYASGRTEGSKAIDIDNRGFLYLLGVNSSPTFIDPNESLSTRTYGIGIMDTKSTTYKQTPRPVTGRLTIICNDDSENESSSTTKTAIGDNIQWYGDPKLSNRIGDGNEFTISTRESDTIYVTQTVDGIESRPNPVIVKLISLPEDDLVVENDSIRAPIKEGISYQWLYNSTPIKNATSHFVKVDTTENYNKFTVLTSAGACQKLLSQIRMSTALERINYFPNPTNSLVTIPLSKGINISNIRIRNVLGEDITAPIITDLDAYKIDLSRQQSGVYLIELMKLKSRTILRVIKY